MARTVRDATLETRSARCRLKARHEPYWKALDRGFHLGYRKGSRGGMWSVRAFLGDCVGAKRYHKAVIGIADDVRDADGIEVLSYSQAQAKARTWYIQMSRRAADQEPDGIGTYTVGDALADYLSWCQRHGRANGTTRAEGAIKVHLGPKLGHLQVSGLKTKRLRQWLAELAESPALVRSRRHAGGVQPRKDTVVDDPEIKRQRRASANRVLTVLKAALNHAWREGKVPSDETWRKVQPFHAVDAPVVRYLTEAESRRLVNACSKDFRQLVSAALLTGCRYGELARLRAHDFNQDSGTLVVRTSKSGKPRHVVLTDEGRQFFGALVAGKLGDAHIFTRDDGHRWGPSHQQRPLLQACGRASISPAVSFHVLRHTYGTTLAMKGVPLAVIAQQLGHADTRMTEKHYAHLAPNYVADTVRANFPNLGVVEKSAIEAFPPTQRGQVSEISCRQNPSRPL